MTFDTPILIPAALVVLFLVVAMTRRRSDGLSPWRRRFSFAVRATSCLLILLALGAPLSSTTPEASGRTLFLLDVSDSMTNERLAESVDDIRRRSADGEGERGVMIFARDCELAVPFQTSRPLPIDASIIASGKRRLGTERTNIERAIRMALPLVTLHGGGEIVLYSDARETEGSSAGLRLPEGVRLILHRFSSEFRDAAVVDAIVPYHIASGSPIPVRAHIRSSHAQPASLEIAVNGEFLPALRKETELPAGDAIVPMGNVPPGSVRPGARNTVEIFLHPKGTDAAKRNNYARRQFHSSGRMTVLLVEGVPGSLGELARFLTPQEIDTVRTTFDDLALESRIDAFDVVVLDGPPPARRRDDIADLLDAFAATHGGGVLLVCREAMDPETGNLARLLPVRFTATPPIPPESKRPPLPEPGASEPEPKIVEAPAITLLLLIDKSGSMAGDNIALAKESCLASAKTLADVDHVAVVAFDAQPYLALDLTAAGRSDYIADRVMRIMAGGGTNIYAALEGAHKVMKNVTTPIKHVILLSDGLTPPADFNTLVGAMRADGITISAVCVGSSDFDPVLPAQIASVGGGRFLFASDFAKVPQIFTNETRYVVKASAKHRNVPPSPKPLPKEPEPTPPPPKPAERREIPLRIAEHHDLLAGILENDLPPLSGIVPAATVEGSQGLIVEPGGAPILALRRHGLGKVAAWTSDIGGKWSERFFESEASRKLFTQLIRAIAPPRMKAARTEEIEPTDREHAGILDNTVLPDLSGGAEERRTDPPTTPGSVAIPLLVAAALLLPIDILLRKGSHDHI